MAKRPLRACSHGRPEADGSARGLERVKCRTGSRSGAQGRSPEHRTGEDRHLTRGRPLYAAGSAGQGFPPAGGNDRAGLPRGERGVWGGAPRFSGHRDATSMARQGQPEGPSDGLIVAQSSGLAKRRDSVAMAGGLGACPQGFQAARHPSNNLIQGNKVPHPCATRLSGLLRPVFLLRPGLHFFDFTGFWIPYTSAAFWYWRHYRELSHGR